MSLRASIISVGTAIIIVVLASDAEAQFLLRDYNLNTFGRLSMVEDASISAVRDGLALEKTNTTDAHTYRVPRFPVLGDARGRAVALESTSDSDSFEWLSNIGGDLFINGEVYGLHLSGIGSLTYGAGPGVEIRVHPFFMGVTAGFGGDEGFSGIHPTNTLFTFYSLYAGVTINDYRVEFGQTYGDNSWWVTTQPISDYTSDFLGISRRMGGIAFFEPEVRLMFPVVAHYSVFSEPYEFTPVTQRYHFGNLYFSFTLKLGIGYN